MSEENEVKIEESLPTSNPPEKKKQKLGPLCISVDCGTMFLACARNDTDQVKLIRNVFLPVKEDEVSISDLSDISYIQSPDGNIYIVGEDAFKFANIFSKEVSRPMEKGLISPKEINALDVLAMIIKDLIGDLGGRETFCSYSIPAEAIDEGRSVVYHERVFGRIFSSLGINHKAVNEASAIIYAECEKEKFSGIGISMGAGMANFCLMFKGVEAAKFSVARSGDWIDRQVADSLNMIPNRVTAVKEKTLNLLEDPNLPKNKKYSRVLEALHFYYESLINYSIKKMIEEFKSKIDIEIDDPIPVVISGGTSMPEGFLDLFKTAFNKYSDFPVAISEIRRATNPLTCVAKGLLIKTMSDSKSK
jgi:hypothetical protein